MEKAELVERYKKCKLATVPVMGEEASRYVCTEAVFGSRGIQLTRRRTATTSRRSSRRRSTRRSQSRTQGRH
jgi:hypothetical protein